MSGKKDCVSLYSRRDLGKLALGAVPAAGLLGRTESLFGFQAKPNSTWGGVPFGVFAPYRFGPEATDLEGALKALVRLGVSNTEVTAGVVENYLGAPQAAAGGRGGAAATGRGANAAPATSPAPGAIACVNGVPGAPPAAGGGAPTKTADALVAWRTSVPMSRFADVRKKFRDAGVSIYAFRATLNLVQSDAEYDYWFNAAKAVGASQITMELPGDPAVSRRIGEAAAQHGVNIGYHLHTLASMTAWDVAMAQSPRNGAQLDIGHWVAGTGVSPVPFIEKNHARIFSLHLKDRKKVCHDRSENMPWGQGDTPIRDVLQTLKKNKWAIPAGIEFEYLVPEGSTWEAEIAKCVKYGKDALA